MPAKVVKLLLFFFVSLSPAVGKAQRFLSDYDTALFIKDTVRPFIKRFENLHFSGYMQPQFQIAQEKGISSFEGGAFATHSSNRFMLRRARIKVDYLLPNKEKDAPKALFTFQIDATERGVAVRDMFLRLYEPKKQNLSLTMGLVARPFGYEINLSSSYRETPERGRMSQTLMPGERDLGAMASYEVLAKKRVPFKFDIGVFNGQGLSGTTDFDSYKDLVSRFTIKPLSLSKNTFISGGLSLLNGGWRQETKYRYEMKAVGSNQLFVADSSLENIGSKAPRHYYGADVQLSVQHPRGKTEVRAEYWKGKQPGVATSTLSPGALPMEPTYIRNFDGAFFYFLQSIANEKWELMLKYDWYDPNTKVAAADIGKSGTNLTNADIKYSTLGAGITRYFTADLKVLAYYSFIRNERTALVGFNNDLPDDVFTLRMQLRF